MLADFEQDHLHIRAGGFAPADLFLSSGPADIPEPFTSVMVASIVKYRADDVAAADGAVPVHASEYNRTRRWRRGGRSVVVEVNDDNAGDGGVYEAGHVPCGWRGD